MGSFTSLVSKQLLHALFPVSTAGSGVSNLTANNAADTTGTLFRIYNRTSTTYGIHAGDKVTVDTRIDLILGSAAAQAVSGNGVLTDAYIGANGLVAAPAGGTATAGNISFPTNGVYNAYTGMALTSSQSGNHQWIGWTIQPSAEASSPVGSWRVDSNGQIGFPTNGNTPGTVVTAFGFVLSAIGMAASNAAATLGTGVCDIPTSATPLKATAPTQPVIFAYGDLSSGRTINNGDTPVFTSGAIKITLD